MKTAATIALCLGGVLLLVYPMAAIFALIGLPSGTKTPVTLDTVLTWCFFYGIFAYPIAYVLCLILSIIMRVKGKDMATFVFSILPLVYLAVFMGIPVAIAWIVEGHRY